MYLFSPVSNKTVNDVSGVNFNNQHCVELLAIIFGQIWLTNLKKKHKLYIREKKSVNSLLHEASHVTQNFVENKILSRTMVILISWQQTGIVHFQIKLLD